MDGQKIDFEIGPNVKCIGSGQSSNVFQALRLDRNPPEPIAVKRIKLLGSADTEEISRKVLEFKTAFDHVKDLRHPNLITHLHIQFTFNPLQPPFCDILMELCEGGCLHAALKRHNRVPLPIVKNLTRQIVTGLEFLHQMRIIHRDLKGENIFLSTRDFENCIVKIGDFGEIKQLATGGTKDTPRSWTSRGTFAFMSPEMIVGPISQDFLVGRKTDIWSLGCVVIEILTCNIPRFFKSNEKNELVEITEQFAVIYHIGNQGHPDIPTDLQEDVHNFIVKCLQFSPEQRPSASDLLRHPFLI